MQRPGNIKSTFRHIEQPTHYEQAVNVKLLYEVMIKIPRTKVNNVISSGFLKIINRRRCEMFNIIESLDEEIIWYIYKYDSMT